MRKAHRLAVADLLEIAAMKGVAAPDQGGPAVAPAASPPHSDVPQAPEAPPQPLGPQGDGALTSTSDAAGGSDAA